MQSYGTKSAADQQVNALESGLDTAAVRTLFRRAVRERQIKISLHAAEEALSTVRGDRKR